MWDLRYAAGPLFTLAHHSDEVFQVRWHPTNPNILASGGADSKILVWDLNDVAEEEDLRNAPAALRFTHMGHTGKINDFSWHRDKDSAWTIASGDCCSTVIVTVAVSRAKCDCAPLFLLLCKQWQKTTFYMYGKWQVKSLR